MILATRRILVVLGAYLSIPREPRWQGEGADARRAAPPVVVTTGKPCNAADAPLLANPSGPGRFPLMRRCRLLIGLLPNLVGSALPEGKSAAVAATRNTQTGSRDAALIPLLSLCVWLYLFFAHGRFWLSAPELLPAEPRETPDVDIIVPARDEAETIGPVIASLLDQQYAGKFQVILVDDDSSDGTAEIARAAAAARGNSSLRVISSAPKPPAWSGKLWAVSQGVAGAEAAVLLLADADIVHDPRHLATLVARLNSPRVDMVSEMVRLNCSSRAEKWL